MVAKARCGDRKQEKEIFFAKGEYFSLDLLSHRRRLPQIAADISVAQSRATYTFAELSDQKKLSLQVFFDPSKLGFDKKPLRS
jgi:hypothetical protein